MDPEWYLPPTDKQWVKRLAKTLKIPLPLAKVLFNRGLREFDQAYSFLYPRLSHLHDPWSLKNIDKAAKRIYQAILKKERVLIYGDYDVDGLSGTAIVYLFLSPFIKHLSYYIPHRLKEGYGLKLDAIKKFKAAGIDVIVSIDCGTSDYEEIKFAQQIGIDVIVFDHHETPSLLPPTYALVNPKQPGCPFPFKELAGVGVAFNLLIALRKFFYTQGLWANQKIPNLKSYLDLVALGTIADMVPLVDENRIFVKTGLEVLTQTNRVGLRFLKISCGLNTNINIRDISFRLIPRLNAAGRISTPDKALKLLITSDEQEAQSLAKTLNGLNQERQNIEEKVFYQAQAQISGTNQSVLVGNNWHQGVIGIVAGRLAETLKRPILLIGLEDGKGKGSGRSIEGHDLFAALSQCAKYLETYGGHKLAAGFTVLEENLEKFLREFEQKIKLILNDSKRPRVYIDAKLNLADLTPQFIKYLSILSPYGVGNPEPIFASPALDIKHSVIVKEKHLKLFVRQQNLIFEAIGFNLASLYPPPNPLYLAFIPYEENWQGERTIKLKIRALRAI